MGITGLDKTLPALCSVSTPMIFTTEELSKRMEMRRALLEQVKELRHLESVIERTHA